MQQTSFSVGNKKINEGSCFIIGEVAQAHDGSLGFAHAHIDAIANAGADAVKFQTHIAEAESSIHEPWRVKFSEQDETRYDYWKRMEFSKEEWLGLKAHAEARGLVFLSSPFSHAAFILLDSIDVPAWKVASGELTNTALISEMAKTGKPVFLSCGMNSLLELEAAVDVVKSMGAPLAVMQCTSSYPTPPEKVGLNLIEEFRQRFDCPVGLSDHSGTKYAGLAGVSLGASMLELHVTLSRDMFGPDVVASVTTDEFKDLIKGVRFIETVLQNPIDKDELLEEFSGYRHIFTKSLFANKDIKKGTIISHTDLIAKKPGTGISANRLDEFVGRTAGAFIKKGDLIKESDIN